MFLHLPERRFWILQVIDHYEKPRNVGSFPKTDVNVGTGLVGAPACGDVMKLQIRVRTATAPGVITSSAHPLCKRQPCSVVTAG